MPKPQEECNEQYENKAPGPDDIYPKIQKEKKKKS